jgi:hypothetical protein
LKNREPADGAGHLGGGVLFAVGKGFNTLRDISKIRGEAGWNPKTSKK